MKELRLIPQPKKIVCKDGYLNAKDFTASAVIVEQVVKAKEIFAFDGAREIELVTDEKIGKEGYRI